MSKFILDICCGPKMFWFNKNHENTIYIDKRIEAHGFIPERPNRYVRPDVLSYFQYLPFKDNTFRLVVMDPPHIHSCGDLFRMAMTFGKLNKQTWAYNIRNGVNEAFRVLKNFGVLIFKWNETQIKKESVLKAIGKEPLFGHPVLSKVPTHWFTFMKINRPESGR